IREATTGNVVNFPQSASASNRQSIGQSASASKIPVSNTNNMAFMPLVGALKERSWKPKTTIRNPCYPAVTSPGCYFVSHSAGFQLIHRASCRYLGHYTKAAIKELEIKYGKKKSRAKNRRR